MGNGGHSNPESRVIQTGSARVFSTWGGRAHAQQSQGAMTRFPVLSQEASPARGQGWLLTGRQANPSPSPASPWDHPSPGSCPQGCR